MQGTQQLLCRSLVGSMLLGGCERDIIILLSALILSHDEWYMQNDFKTAPAGICSGQAAALAGGTTMVIDFALPVHHDLEEGYKSYESKTKTAVADYALHMAVTRFDKKAPPFLHLQPVCMLPISSLISQASNWSFHAYLTLSSTLSAMNSLLWALRLENLRHCKSLLCWRLAGFARIHLTLERCLQASEDMATMAARGINSFKFFMAYKGILQITDEELIAGFQRSKELGAIPMVRSVKLVWSIRSKSPQQSPFEQPTFIC